MAEKDLVEKKLEDHNDVFADILNTLLFQKRVLKESNLWNGPTESVYKSDRGKLHGQCRDTFKKYGEGLCLIIASFGIENQSGYERTMPVRIMGYDSASYKDQIEHEKGKLHPVITVVLNFSDSRWNKVKSLRDLMGTIPEELEPYFQDYRIHVFDIAFLEDSVIDSFQSDFRAVARFFRNRRLGQPALADDTELNYPEEITELMAVFTGEKRYMDLLPDVKAAKQKGARMAMCWVAQELIEKGERQGEMRGEERGEMRGEARGRKQGETLMATLMQRLFADGRMEDAKRAADSERDRKELYQEYGLMN